MKPMKKIMILLFAGEAVLGFAQQNDDLARLEKLIAIPSVSSNIVEVNRAVDFLSEELRRDGLWCRIETMADGRRVLFAANGESQKPNILLSSHLDVVPVIDPAQFVPHRKNGRIYGRGAADH